STTGDGGAFFITANGGPLVVDTGSVTVLANSGSSHGGFIQLNGQGIIVTGASDLTLRAQGPVYQLGDGDIVVNSNGGNPIEAHGRNLDFRGTGDTVLTGTLIDLSGDGSSGAGGGNLTLVGNGVNVGGTPINTGTSNSGFNGGNVFMQSSLT